MKSATYRRKVRYSDTDVQGFVFNANYFVYVDDALTDFFEEVDVSFQALADRGLDPVVVHAECDFLSPARLGDLLATTVTVETFGNTSITFVFDIVEEQSSRSVAGGREVYVMLNRSSHEPTAVPDDVREAFGDA